MINLCNPSNRDIQLFVRLITDLAIEDELEERKTIRSGAKLVDMFCSQSRKGHVRMASSIYNKVRWTIATAKKRNGL